MLRLQRASVTERIALYALLGLTVFRLIVAVWLPVTPDEAYYWTWSRHLQFSYLDHPPMVALWIHFGTMLFGDTAFGIRVMAPLAAAAGTVIAVLATKEFLACRKEETPETGDIRPLVTGILLNAMLAVGTGAVLMTPDTPLLFFVTLFLWAAGKLLRTGDAGWWLLLGLNAGLGFDSKYTMVLPIAGLGAWCLLRPTGRRFLLTFWPWVGLCLAALLSTPVVWWNATHGWASFIRQGGRTGDWHPARAFSYIGELLGGQIGLLTPGIFLLAIVACVRAARRRDDADRLLVCLIAVPCAVFLQHALGDRVQPNWPVIVYPVLAIVIAMSGMKGWKPAVWLGYGMWAVVIVQSATGLLPLNRHLDVTLRQSGGWEAFAQDIGRASKGADFVMSDEYGVASELALRLKGREIVGAELLRWPFFELPLATCTKGWVLLVHNARRSFTPGTPWAEAGQPVGEIIRSRNGREAERYGLYRVVCPIPSPTAEWLRELPSAR